jgi:glycosyltransferase involved in cell wall biosynthesis
MKLFVTIPAYNEEQTIASVIREIPRQIDGIDEVRVLVLDDGSKDKTKEKALSAGADFVISHKENKGLAITFKDAIEEALLRGADIIVNTDADNHYNQSRIPELVKPILAGEADIVIGGREIEKIDHMPWPNKYGNILGSWFVCKLANLPKLDVSSGFRAYTKEAALKMNVLSSHTYTHESLIQAHDHGLIIKEIPIQARKVKRKSRLIKSIPKHIAKSLAVIFRVFTLYKPMRIFLGIGMTVFITGLIPIIRFLSFYFAGQGSGHIQSLIIGSMVVLIGFMICVIALLASAIGWNRKMLEEILYKLKENEVKKGK